MSNSDNIKMFQQGQYKSKNYIRLKTVSISDFSFQFAGYGHYRVKYTSPVTGKCWTATTNNMPLIDCTKNTDDPKKKDLETLKRVVKNR